ncbi:hypothetical protein [Hydrogenophaga sp.]|uniref:hypothetical protein n=1 Tax=Hydrogenophaga sp. TaxID=1904254 RepID=UPI00272826BC|nr:hypothetical protein [Hydrogenophaga sp.]MDO8905952.1 hypothetical protein [Hydrogenophaga sp.]
MDMYFAGMEHSIANGFEQPEAATSFAPTTSAKEFRQAADSWSLPASGLNTGAIREVDPATSQGNTLSIEEQSKLEALSAIVGPSSTFAKTLHELRNRGWSFVLAGGFSRQPVRLSIDSHSTLRPAGFNVAVLLQLEAAQGQVYLTKDKPSQTAIPSPHGEPVEIQLNPKASGKAWATAIEKAISALKS